MYKTVPPWFVHRIFTGSDNEGADENSTEANLDGEDSEGKEDEEGEASSESNSSEDDLEGLRKALAAERRLRKKAERANRQKKDQEVKDTEQVDLEATQRSLTAERERTSKLATRLRNNEVASAIQAEATRQGFIDPTDALTSGVIGAVEVDQDDIDPSDIEVDMDSVKVAVADLARKKKHLLTPTESSDSKEDDKSQLPPSGSRFSPKKKKGDDTKTKEAKYLETYPSLR